MRTLMLALAFGMAAALAPTSAPAICESSDRYWSCVTTVTDCTYSHECTEYFCTNHQEMGRRHGYYVNLCG